MRRAPSRAARSVRLEVTRGGDVVHGEDYRAAPSVVLSRAEEAFGDGHLVSDLPGSVLLHLLGAPVIGVF